MIVKFTLPGGSAASCTSKNFFMFKSTLQNKGKNPNQVEYPVESLSSSNEFLIFKLDFLGMTPVRHAVT